MHLGPDVWGPHLWKALHMITMGYPNEPTDEQKKNYKSFFENFYLVIPCSVCSNNYKEHLIDIPLTNDVLKNKESLAKWVIDIHNLVNKATGKNILTHDEALALIKNNFQPLNSSVTDSDNIPIGVSSSINTTNYLPVDISIQNSEFKPIKKEIDENKFYPLWILMIILVALVMIAIAYKKN